MRERRCVEDLQIILIDRETVGQVESWLTACERCAANAITALDYVIDAVTGRDGAAAEYLMSRPATCPSCSNKITEKTLVVL